MLCIYYYFLKHRNERNEKRNKNMDFFLDGRDTKSIKRRMQTMSFKLCVLSESDMVRAVCCVATSRLGELTFGHCYGVPVIVYLYFSYYHFSPLRSLSRCCLINSLLFFGVGTKEIIWIGKVKQKPLIPPLHSPPTFPDRKTKQNRIEKEKK